MGIPARVKEWVSAVRSDRVLVAREVAANEMVPGALGANLDHVTRELAEALAKLHQIRATADAPVLSAFELFAVGVEQDAQPGVLADRARFAGFFADEPSRPHELWVCIAYVGDRAKTAAKVA